MEREPEERRHLELTSRDTTTNSWSNPPGDLP